MPNPTSNLLDRTLATEMIGVVEVPSGAFSECFELESKEITWEASPKTKGILGTVKWVYKGADTLNVNKRIYPREVLDPQVRAMNDKATAGRLYGELDHPGFFDEQDVPMLDRASHRITGVSMNGDQVTVEAVILKGDKGKQMASCYQSGGDVAISHRARVKWREPTDEDRTRFKLSKDTAAVVAADLRLITWDAVSDPGHKDAFTRTAQLHENKQPEGTTTMPLIREDMNKPENAGVRDLILAEGRAAGIADEDNKKKVVEAAKPAIVEEAQKELKAQVVTLTTQVAEKTKALESIRTQLTEAGVISKESISGTEAATKIATLTTEAGVTKGELATAQKQLKDATDKLAGIEAKQGVTEAVAELSTKFKTHKHLNLILDAAKAAPNKADALKVGEAKKIEIDGMLQKLGVKGEGGGGSPANTNQDAANGANGKNGTEDPDGEGNEAVVRKNTNDLMKSYG